MVMFLEFWGYKAELDALLMTKLTAKTYPLNAK